MSSGSKCLADQCSSPGTMTFTTGMPTSDLVRSTAMTCSRPADCSRCDMKPMSSRMSSASIRRDSVESLQRTVGEPQTLRRPVRLRHLARRPCRCLPSPPEKSSTGSEPARSAPSSQPLAHPDECQGRCGNGFGQRRALPNPRQRKSRTPISLVISRITRANTGRRKLPCKTRRHVRKRIQVDDREQLAVRGCMCVCRQMTREPCSDRSGDRTNARKQHSADDRQRPRISFDHLRQSVTHRFFDRVARGQTIRTAAKHARDRDHHDEASARRTLEPTPACRIASRFRGATPAARSPCNQHGGRETDSAGQPHWPGDEAFGNWRMWIGAAGVRNSSAQSLPSWRQLSHASASALCHSARRWTSRQQEDGRRPRRESRHNPIR